MLRLPALGLSLIRAAVPLIELFRSFLFHGNHVPVLSRFRSGRRSQPSVRTAKTRLSL